MGTPDVLRLAAQRADVVALSGLGRTLPDGHRHEVRWSPEQLQSQLRVVHDDAKAAGRAPAVEALVQLVVETPDRATTLDELAGRFIGATADQLSSTPFLLIGTPKEMAEQLVRQAEQCGIGRYVVREPAVTAIEPVLNLLAARAGN